MSTVSSVLTVAGAALFAAGPVLPFVEARVSRAGGRDRRARVARPPLSSRPTIDALVPAYLESSVIADTVQSVDRQLTAAGLPHRVIVVASDDETAAAAAAAGAVTRLTEPRGKPAAVNFGMGLTTADVVVLTDGNCRITPDTWPTRLLEFLGTADLVSAPKMEYGTREQPYWQYEKAVKKFGGAGRETLSVVGEFLAFRREDFDPIPTDVLADDLYMAESFTLRGLSVQTCGDIQTIEKAAPGDSQIERRVRISAGHWAQAIPRWRQLLKFPAGRQFLAHKGYRMSLGALGFWTALLGVGLLATPWSMVAVVAGAGCAWVVYRYLDAAPWILRLASTVVVLQAVTVLGLLRALRRRSTRRPHHGWKKVAR